MEVAQSRSDGLDVRVLGTLEVYRGGHRVNISGRRARGLLALLARSVGRPVPLPEIVRQVWGLDGPGADKPAVRNAVQARVSSLRRVLGRAVLRAVPGGYVLELAAPAIDVFRFETALAEARALRLVAGAGDIAEAYRRATGSGGVSSPTPMSGTSQCSPRMVTGSMNCGCRPCRRASPPSWTTSGTTPRPPNWSC